MPETVLLVSKDVEIVTIKFREEDKIVTVNRSTKSVEMIQNGIISNRISSFLLLLTVLHDFEPLLIDDTFKHKINNRENNDPEPPGYEGEEGYDPYDPETSSSECEHTVGSSYAIYGTRSQAANRAQQVVMENVDPNCDHFSWIGSVDCGCLWGDFYCICVTEYCHSDCFD